MGFLRRGNYDENTVDMIINHAKRYVIRSKTELIHENLYYVGITANPVQSLSAHGINLLEENTFFCMDIPKASAKICKQMLMALDGYEATTNKDNDYYNTPYQQLYVYIYKVSDKTNENINISSFTPLEKLPEKPIVVKLHFTNGTNSIKYLDHIDQNKCDELTSKILDLITSDKLMEFCIVHHELNRLYAEFGEKCCVLNYDSGTSQVGGYQNYRSGEKSRKKVKLYTKEYPEYMLCRDFSVLESVLKYFLLKGKKPTKRQNIKWVYMK